MTSGDIIAEPIRIFQKTRSRGHGQGRHEREGVNSLWKGWPLPLFQRTAIPRVFRGQRQRIGKPGPGAAAQADTLRRAGLGLGRFHPVPDPQFVQGPSAGVRPDLSLHRPTIWGHQVNISRPGGGHVPGIDSWRYPEARTCTRSPCILIPGAFAGAPIPTPGRAQRRRIILTGDVPSPNNKRPGCYFYDRCSQAQWTTLQDPSGPG